MTPALTRPIRWDLVEQNYDQMIKYATAIRQGTASTEAILRRFTRSASHPTYQAMLEVGRAQRTIFVARYLRRRELQREITEGFNVVESFNGAHSVICYGKGGEITSNRKEEQEMTVLCLRILQAALVYVNTLLLQDVLAEADWADTLTAEDRRSLTSLFWQHVLPYGEVKLDMTARLSIRTTHRTNHQQAPSRARRESIIRTVGQRQPNRRWPKSCALRRATVRAGVRGRTGWRSGAARRRGRRDGKHRVRSWRQVPVQGGAGDSGLGDDLGDGVVGIAQVRGVGELVGVDDGGPADPAALGGSGGPGAGGSLQAVGAFHLGEQREQDDGELGHRVGRVGGGDLDRVGQVADPHAAGGRG
jgi:hypothetical protein